MPSQTRQQQTTTTSTGASSTATQGTSGGDNAFLAALLSGQERLDGDAKTYFAHGITFQKGMKGELIKRVQEAIGAGQDGGFGSITEGKLKAWQKKNGLPETGTVDEATWSAVVAATRSLKNLSGDEDFEAMWAAHPRNNYESEHENTDSGDLIKQLGLPEGSVPNTCALRLSTMLNRMGGNLTLTTDKGRQAGLDKMRSGGLYMPRVKDELQDGKDGRVVLSAREMWTYIEKFRGKPDFEWPARGRFKTEEEAIEGAKHVESVAAGQRGFVAFDKIYGYGGTGHVDIFKGTELSAAKSWYPSQSIKLWYV